MVSRPARALSRHRQTRNAAAAGRATALASALYGEMLGHYGVDFGMRHARKHLGWALDTAAAVAGVSAEILKAARGRVLTASDPAIVLHRLAEAFDMFGAVNAARPLQHA